MVSELELEWRDVFDDSRNETLENEVLSALMPHSDNLEDLSIMSYGDKVFPSWIGDSKFVRLSRISVSRCRKCTFLPPLGNLPSLKKLFIKDMDEVKDVGSEFVGAGSGPAFPSLESLWFQDMRGWEVWSTTVGGGVRAVFPCLQELELRNCPNLDVVSLKPLPSLRVLEISDCGDGVLRSLIRVASSVTNLSIQGISVLTDEVWRDAMKHLGAVDEVSLKELPSLRILKIKKCGYSVLRSLIRLASSVTNLSIEGISGLGDEVCRVVMEHLGAVEEVTIRECNEIKYLWESEAKASNVLVNLRKLEVWFCEELVSLGEKEEDDSSWGNQLKSLLILGCKKLERCSCPNNIEQLNIKCSPITHVSFPEGGCQKLKSVRIWECNKLVGKEVEKMFLTTSMPMLQEVSITGWRNLKEIIGLPCFDHVTSLTITSWQGTDASFEHWPPRLRHLDIRGSKKPISQWGPHNFPTTLVGLSLLGRSAEEDDVTTGSQFSHILPKSLTYLRIEGFKKLESLSVGLEHLTRLQNLEIFTCPKMKDLPEKLFTSLLCLRILRCPNLKEKISRRGSYWPGISHIPSVGYIGID